MTSALTRLCAEAEEEGESRASVMNLVAWARDEGDAAGIESAIASLADHQPSRALIVTRGPGTDGIDARVHTHSGPSAAAHHEAVRIEQVTLRLRGAVGDHAASVVVPLLRPDLPTFLWWPGPPDEDDPAFRELAGLSDRVITEAGRADDPAAAAVRLHRAAASGGPVLTDLAWAALTPWRQLLTQVGATRPGDPLLPGARALEIVHTGARPTLAALLLAGWALDVIGANIGLGFVPGEGDDALMALRVAGEDGGHLVIERIPGRPTAEVTADTPGEDRRVRVLPLPRRSREALLAGELEFTRRDRPFERALERAAALAA